MRYTTQRFGETIYLLGEFGSGRAVGQVTIALYDLSSPGTAVPLTSAVCTEITGSSAGDFSTYYWPSSNVTIPALTPKQYLYIMSDSVTGRVQKGKFTVGGHPDNSAKNRYNQEVHVTSSGTALVPVGTLGAYTSLTYAAGTPATITRVGGSWTADGFAVGDYIQISGADLNNGVFGPITTVTATVLTFTNGHNLIQNDTDLAGADAIVSKSYLFDVGTLENPAATIADAFLIALALDLSTYHIRDGSSYTISFPHPDWVFTGDDPDADIITFEGHDNSGAVCNTIGIRGTLNGRIVAVRCIIGAQAGTVDGLQGVLTDCGVAGLIKVAAAGTITGLTVAARDLTGVQLSFANGGSGTSALLGGVLGIWSITNMTVANNICGIAALGAVLSVANSCTAGTIQIGGVGELSVQNNVTATVTDQVVRGTRIDERFSDIIAFVA